MFEVGISLVSCAKSIQLILLRCKCDFILSFGARLYRYFDQKNFVDYFVQRSSLVNVNAKKKTTSIIKQSLGQLQVLTNKAKRRKTKIRSSMGNLQRSYIILEILGSYERTPLKYWKSCMYCIRFKREVSESIQRLYIYGEVSKREKNSPELISFKCKF